MVLGWEVPTDVVLSPPSPITPGFHSLRYEQFFQQLNQTLQPAFDSLYTSLLDESRFLCRLSHKGIAEKCQIKLFFFESADIDHFSLETTEPCLATDGSLTAVSASGFL